MTFSEALPFGEISCQQRSDGVCAEVQQKFILWSVKADSGAGLLQEAAHCDLIIIFFFQAITLQRAAGPGKEGLCVPRVGYPLVPTASPCTALAGDRHFAC